MTLAALAASASVAAADLRDACGAASSYDLTLTAPALVFERAAPAPLRIELGAATLRADGRALALGTEDRDRVALLYRNIHALVPPVKALAKRGVDLAADAVREQAATLAAGDTAALDARLDHRRRELHARIDASRSTRDWQGDAFERYGQQLAADILPLLAETVGQRALDAALQGDLGAASALQGELQALPDNLQTRLHAKLRQLQPEVRALCPRIVALDRIETGIGVRLADGSALDLLEIEAASATQ